MQALEFPAAIHSTYEDTEERKLRAALFAALIHARTEFENPTKKSAGYGYDYADLSEVIGCTQPALNRHGLTIIQFVTTSEPNTISVRTMLVHKDGGFLEDEGAMLVTTHKGMSREQCEGTAISYLRRYSWLAVCGLPQGDVDGKARPDWQTSKGSKGKLPEAPRPAGDPPVTTVDGRQQSVAAARPEWWERAAEEHHDPAVRQWAAFFHAGGSI